MIQPPGLPLPRWNDLTEQVLGQRDEVIVGRVAPDQQRHAD
jgi:hypothetical protein